MTIAARLSRRPVRLAGPLGFGAAEIGNLTRRLSEAEAQAALAAAWEAGFRIFDTAPGYGAGLSELRLGAFLRDKPRGDYVLSTKIGRCFSATSGQPRPGAFAAPLPFVEHVGYGYDAVMRSFEQSTLRLGLTHFDLLLVHDLDRRNHGAAFDGHYRDAFDGGMRALGKLRRAGDVGSVGVAVNEGDVGTQMIADGDFDVALLASRYTLLEQTALTDLLPAAQARGLPVLAGGIFNSGILAAAPVSGATYDYRPAGRDVLDRVDRLRALCDRHGVTLAAAALQFVLAHPAIDAVLIGMSQPDRAAAGVALFGQSIPPAFWTALRAERLVAEAAPLPTGDAWRAVSARSRPATGVVPEAVVAGPPTGARPGSPGRRPPEPQMIEGTS